MGRKRKPGARYPSGDLKPAIDRGTPELQARRKFDAGTVSMKDGDPNLTVTILGILRANDQLTEDEYQSCCDYRKTFAVVYRKPEISAAGGTQESGSVIPEKTLIELKAKMKKLEWAIQSVVRDEGRIAKDTWDNLVLYGRRPRWMCPVVPRESDIREAHLFMLVVKAVTEACGRERRAA